MPSRPRPTLPLVDAGFAVRGRLRVLAHDLAAAPRRDRTDAARPAPRTRTCCSATDQAAFDEFWRFDRDGLAQAARATPSARVPRSRVARRRRPGRVRARSAARTPTATCSDSPSTRTSQGRGRRRGAAHRRPAAGCASAARRARTSTRSPTTTAPTRCTSASGSRRCPSACASSDARCEPGVRRALALVLGACSLLASVAVPAIAVAAAGDRGRHRSSRCWRSPRGHPYTATSPLRLDIPASLLPQDQDVQLRMRMHQPVTTTTAFDRTIEGDRLGNRIDTKTVPVSTLAARRAGRRAAHLRPAGLRDGAALRRADAARRLPARARAAHRHDARVVRDVDRRGRSDDDAGRHRPGALGLDLERRGRARRATPTDRRTEPCSPSSHRAAASPTSPTSCRAPAPMPLTLEVGPETLESWEALAQADCPPRGRASRASRPRSSGRRTSCCRRRTSRSISPRSRPPGSVRSSPTSCAPAPRRWTRSPASPPTLAPRSSTPSTRRRSRGYAACSSIVSSCARRRSPTSRVRTRSPRSR